MHCKPSSERPKQSFCRSSFCFFLNFVGKRNRRCFVTVWWSRLMCTLYYHNVLHFSFTLFRQTTNSCIQDAKSLGIDLFILIIIQNYLKPFPLFIAILCKEVYARKWSTSPANEQLEQISGHNRELKVCCCRREGKQSEHCSSSKWASVIEMSSARPPVNSD